MAGNLNTILQTLTPTVRRLAELSGFSPLNLTAPKGPVSVKKRCDEKISVINAPISIAVLCCCRVRKINLTI